jgi:hypothetical protein
MSSTPHPSPRCATVTWVLEGPQPALATAVEAAGHRLVKWDDAWWATDQWPDVLDGPVLFHGTLATADQIGRALPRWSPGAYCAAAAFRCSAWYRRARPWLLHQRWRGIAASALAADPEGALAPLGAPELVFLRPDGGLAAAAQILPRAELRLAVLALAHHHGDPDLRVVVAPARRIGRQWRYVVADRQVIAGSAHEPAAAADPSHPAWALAAEVAERLPAPEEVYVLEICEADDQLRLRALAPFSGSDLLAAPAAPIVAAVSVVASHAWSAARRLASAAGRR